MGTDTPTSTEGHGAAKELYFLECGGILEAVGRLGFVESVWIMGRYAWLKKLGQSLLRIAVALSVLLGIPALLYWLWTPGIAEAAGKFDQGCSRSISGLCIRISARRNSTARSLLMTMRRWNVFWMRRRSSALR